MIKRLIIKMLVMTVIFTGIAVYVASINGIDVKKALSVAISNTHLPSLPRPDQLVPDALELPSQKKQVYKWKDAEGVWHFSSEKPQGEGIELIELHPGRNVVRAVELPQPEVSEDAQGSGQSEGQAFAKRNQEVLFPYSPDAVKELIQDAKDVQNKVDERYKRLEETVGN